MYGKNGIIFYFEPSVESRSELRKGFLIFMKVVHMVVAEIRRTVSATITNKIE